jgi:hypothetical protein
MELVGSGLVMSVILGAFAMAVVLRVTRDRRRAPLKRGRAERAVEYGAGIFVGLATLFTLMLLCPEVTPATREAALLGITLAMPASAAATWLAGELIAGPTEKSWRPLIFAFLAAQAGFIAPLETYSWLDRPVLSGFLGEAHALALSAALITSFLVGGGAGAWAYRRWRKECVLLLVLIAGLGCSRREKPFERQDGAAVPDRGPSIKTMVRRTIDRFEERQALAFEAQRKRNAETGKHMKVEGIHTVRLDAASQRQFAQIWWAARYPHGQHVTPRVAIDRFTIRCTVDLSPDVDAGAASDWTDFETKIDNLPSGRYRVIAPLHEVTVDVPSVWTH